MATRGVAGQIGGRLRSRFSGMSGQIGGSNIAPEAARTMNRGASGVGTGNQPRTSQPLQQVGQQPVQYTPPSGVMTTNEGGVTAPPAPPQVTPQVQPLDMNRANPNTPHNTPPPPPAQGQGELLSQLLRRFAAGDTGKEQEAGESAQLTEQLMGRAGAQRQALAERLGGAGVGGGYAGAQLGQAGAATEEALGSGLADIHNRGLDRAEGQRSQALGSLLNKALGEGAQSNQLAGLDLQRILGEGQLGLQNKQVDQQGFLALLNLIYGNELQGQRNIGDSLNFGGG